MSDEINVHNLQEDISNALAHVLAEYEQSQVTKWVLILETFDLMDAERGLWVLTNPNAKAWDTKGMLQHAVDMQQARSIVEELHDDE